MADSILEFKDISYEHMGYLQRGRMKLTDNQVQFKNQKTGKLDSTNVDNVRDVQWQRLANTPGIKVTVKDGNVLRYGGFTEADFEKIKAFVYLHWKMEMPQIESCVRGWNYGKAQFDGPVMEFEVDNKSCFELPLSYVSNATQGKNEAIVEFHQNDECPVGLVEMRFHVPPEQESDGDPLEEFLKNMLEYAGIVRETEKPLAVLSEVLCTTPRGRYEIKVFPSHLSLHGKTYDYKIPIKSVVRLFLLTHKDGRHMYFVIGLDPPIRQGLTRYPYMVLEFTKEQEVDITIQLTEEQIKEKYGEKLEKNISGPYYEVVARIMRALVNQRVTIPGSFVGNSGTPAVSCAYKSIAGFLYPLEKGFVYIHKPAMYIRFEEVSTVYFARSDVSTRSFDFEIEMKNSEVRVFNSIEKEEYTRLYDFIHKKQLPIRNAKKGGSGKIPTYAEDAFAGSDEDGETDHYSERLKREAKEREQQALGDDDDDDESSEDSDYDPSNAKKAESEEGSEPDDEYDSNAADSSDSDADAAGKDGASPSPKKAKKEKKRRRDDDDESPKKARSGTKRGKKDKDPNAPKRGMSAYMLWMNATRESLKEPGMSIGDVAKKAGLEWGKLDAEQKAPWDVKAKADKERYEKELAEYKKNGGAAAASSKSKSSSSSKSKSKAATSVSPSKAISKEYVSSSDASSSDEDDKPLAAAKHKKSTAAKPKESPAKTDEKSDKSESGSEEASSEDNSD